MAFVTIESWIRENSKESALQNNVMGRMPSVSLARRAVDQRGANENLKEA
jgi:hypothetical protein